MYTSTITQCEVKTVNDRQPTEDAEPIQLPKGINPVKRQIIWRNAIVLLVLHIVSVYNFANGYRDAKLWTWIFPMLYGVAGGVGITAGSHRFWAHRTYSARLPLRIFLAYLHCIAGQTHLTKWVRDHRTHHKYTETPADPHDASRGFFFSHIGWLMVKRHPAVKEYGSKIDMSDLAADPVVRFFDKYYTFIMPMASFVLPTLIPVYVWDETWFIAVNSVIIRYVWSLHATFAVNSFAHMWGNRPFNRNLKSTENPVVSFFTLGEGWHNYHHCFPWDYRAAELGSYGLNPSTGFIELMAWLGLAYNLKTPSKEVVGRTYLKKGDGTDSFWGHRRQ